METFSNKLFSWLNDKNPSSFLVPKFFHLNIAQELFLKFHFLKKLGFLGKAKKVIDQGMVLKSETNFEFLFYLQKIESESQDLDEIVRMEIRKNVLDLQTTFKLLQNHFVKTQNQEMLILLFFFKLSKSIII